MFKKKIIHQKKNVHVTIRNWVRPRSTKNFPQQKKNFLIFYFSFPDFGKNSGQKTSREQWNKKVYFETICIVCFFLYRFIFYVSLVGRQKNVEAIFNWVLSLLVFLLSSIAFIYFFLKNKKVDFLDSRICT